MLFEKAKSYEKGDNGRDYTWVAGRSLSDVEKMQKPQGGGSNGGSDGCAICHL